MQNNYQAFIFLYTCQILLKYNEEALGKQVLRLSKQISRKGRLYCFECVGFEFSIFLQTTLFRLFIFHLSCIQQT